MIAAYEHDTNAGQYAVPPRVEGLSRGPLRRSSAMGRSSRPLGPSGGLRLLVPMTPSPERLDWRLALPVDVELTNGVGPKVGTADVRASASLMGLRLVREEGHGRSVEPPVSTTAARSRHSCRT